MECEFCGEDANVVFAIANQKDGERREIRLCRLCAEKLSSFFPGRPHFLQKKDDAEKEKVACPACGMTLKTFEANQTAGCPHCYSFFKNQILADFKKNNVKAPFSGELPKNFQENAMLQESAEALSKKLNEAVEKKDYAAAARFRDELKKISASPFDFSSEKNDA